MVDFNFSSSDPWTGSLDFVFGFYILYTLRGDSNEVSSIWADSDASVELGCFYITTSGCLMKVNASSLLVEDFYSLTEAGRYNEVLNYENTEDLNVI